MKTANKIIPWVLFVIALIFSGYSQMQLAQIKSGPAKPSQEETLRIVDLVGKLIILPQDETPTIATVSDLDKLKDQPFFANAQVGDNVLIYSIAKKAILYRQSINKVIEIAPLNTNNQIPTSGR